MGSDFDRCLSARGRVRTERVARELGARGESPKRILSSPLKRAAETAEIVVATLRLPFDVELRDELSPGGQGFQLVGKLLGEGAKRVMLVGHEPDISHLAAQLVPGWARAFDKAMIAAFKLDRDAWASPTSKPLASCAFVID